MRLYPFRSRWFDAPRGRIHYVDEGQGMPIVFLHGNPSWSFEYRGPIAALRDRYRCIAPDHLGFGLSGRASDPAAYHPAVHAGNFAALMDRLDLQGAVLVVSDWGGPIGFDWARKEPGRIAGLVIMNSWCWPVNRDLRLWLFSALMSSPLGQILVKRYNIFVKWLMPLGAGNRAAFTGEVMAHYTRVQGDEAARAASAAFPGYIIGAGDWLADIWNHRAAFADKPALLLWGLRDPAFRRKQLQVWQSALANVTVRELPDCGHFVAEEAPETVSAEIDAFIQRQVPAP